ncbi:MAG: type II secretion system F family protein [Planctomycetaceae bacterium]|nr:type II secretion system F family protein [Planctomycetota bacterium]NUN51499.1 type II secretion system F family protein [Planctomycetaceae bacterium]
MPARAPGARDSALTPAEAPRRSGGAFRFLDRVDEEALTRFTTQLSVLQDAGLPIVRCLKILEGQMPPGLFKRTLMAVTEDVEAGSPLSEALAKHPAVFDSLYSNMVKAGEAGGVLDTILLRLAEFKEKSIRLRNRVKSAMIYPVVVLTLAGGILAGIIMFVIPKFETIFKEIGSKGLELPKLTQMMQAFSKWLTDQYGWAILLGMVPVAYAVFRMIGSTEGGRRALDRFKLRAPIFGGIVRKTLVARFSRTFGTLISSGVPILEALSIVRGAIPNVVMQTAIDRVRDSIREGEGIAAPLGASGIFDDLVVNMVDVGEETGELDKMLIKVADNYDEEVDNAVNGLVSILQPLLIVFLGGAVFVIVLSVFLPMLQLIKTLGGG